jgi:hypothetical protein
VQALELERTAVREVVDRRDRVRVVRGELRVDEVAARGEEALRAGEVGHVGVRLARVDRIAGQALFLRALDFESQYAPLTRRTHQRRPALRAVSASQSTTNGQRFWYACTARPKPFQPASEGSANTLPMMSSESSRRSASSASTVMPMPFFIASCASSRTFGVSSAWTRSRLATS